MYETLRIVEKLKPRYVIWENVKGILSQKHRHNFDAYQKTMESFGYKNFYQVLNAKDYGVPQNRERVFTVSVYNGFAWSFKFPEPRPLQKRLGDVLEDKVDERYYLSDERLKNIKLWEERQKENGRGFRFEVKTGGSIARTMTASNDRPADSTYVKIIGDTGVKGHEQIRRIYDKEGLSPTLSTMQGGDRQPKVIDDTFPNRNARVYGGVAPTLRSERTGFKVAEPFVVASRGRNPDNPLDRTAGAPTRQRLEPKFDGTTNTLTSVQKDNYVATPYRIRKLMPKECWRLMGFDDEDFEKASKVCSNTQLYKQAGNSIVVNVLEAIFQNLL